MIFVLIINYHYCNSCHVPHRGKVALSAFSTTASMTKQAKKGELSGFLKAHRMTPIKSPCMFSRSFMRSRRPLCILNFDLQHIAFSNQILREQATNILSNQFQDRIIESDCTYLFKGSKAQINLKRGTKDRLVIGTGLKGLGYLYKTERLFL